MTLEFVVALVIAIPFVVLPAALSQRGRSVLAGLDRRARPVMPKSAGWAPQETS